jgi:hypothetical protein
VLWLVEGFYTLFLSLGYRTCQKRDPKPIFIFTLSHGLIWWIFNVFVFLVMATSTESWLLPQSLSLTQNLSITQMLNIIVIGSWIISHELLLIASCIAGIWTCKYFSLALDDIQADEEDIPQRETSIDSDFFDPVPVVMSYAVRPHEYWTSKKSSPGVS